MKKLTILLLLSTSLSTFAGSQLDFTLSDFCHKQPNVQDRGGVYYFPNEEVGITKSSLCVYKDAYGQYASKGKLKDGKKDGKWTVWHENGQKQSERNYKDGKRDGNDADWNMNGQKVSEGYYKDGKANGKFTFWNSNGHKEMEGKYTDGKKNGKWTETEWHQNAQNYYPKYTERNYEYDYCIDCGYKSEKERNEMRTELYNSGKETDDISAYELMLLMLDGTDQLKYHYINQITSRVKSNWRYQGAEDSWNCQVYILQDMNGVVESVNLQSCDIGDSAKAKSFRDSIERAVYKSSPLPTAPFESVFDREIIFYFRVN